MLRLRGHPLGPCRDGLTPLSARSASFIAYWAFLNIKKVRAVRSWTWDDHFISANTSSKQCATKCYLLSEFFWQLIFAVHLQRYWINAMFHRDWAKIILFPLIILRYYLYSRRNVKSCALTGGLSRGCVTGTYGILLTRVKVAYYILFRRICWIFFFLLRKISLQ